MDNKFDLVLVGGGNAITLAIEAGKAGRKVAVIEKGPLGGTCPNRGCIPSKLLIGYAEVAETVRDAGRFHMEATLGHIDTAKLLKETFDATRKTDERIRENLPDNVTLFRGHGTFISDKTVLVNDIEVTGAQIVIATGGRPRRPDLKGLPYWTSDDIFDLTEVPKSITIVGGGYIGVEMAHFFHGVGVETTVISRGGTLLRAEDEEIQRVFCPAFGSRIPVMLNTVISKVDYRDGLFNLKLKNKTGQECTHTSEALLFAIGRDPNSDSLGLENTTVERNDHGYIKTDDCLRTTADGVSAMGDVIGRYFFTHSASFESAYLGQRLLEGHAVPIDYGPMPHAIFSSPQIAGVGATEQGLRGAGTAFKKMSVPYTTAAKGRALKEEHGLCKFLIDPEGKILGCHIVGHEASTLLHQVIPVMKWRNHISSLTEMIYVHPSLAEVIRNAARKTIALL
jgi:mycothione reductase